jgi:GNAT superfamily N-acetyltransferase
MLRFFEDNEGLRMREKIIEIRTATADDAAGIATVHAKSWQETYKGFMPQEFLDSITSEQRLPMWKRETSNPLLCEWLWVAVSNGKIVGFINGGKPRENHAASELYAIYLLKEFQGNGVGRGLFQRLTTKVREEGLDSMYLWVLEGNPTCKIYDAFGGNRTITTKTDKVWGQTVNEVLYTFHIHQ